LTPSCLLCNALPCEIVTGDILSVLRDIHLAYQQELMAIEVVQQLLQDNHEALKIKYSDLKKHYKDL